MQVKIEGRMLDFPQNKTLGVPVLQVLTWVLSYDGEQSPEPLAITAAGAALAVSGIPPPTTPPSPPMDPST